MAYTTEPAQQIVAGAAAKPAAAHKLQAAVEFGARVSWPARFAYALWNLPTVRMFRADRLLCVLSLAMAIVTLAPLTATPFVPLQDLPDHVGMTSIWWDALTGNALPARHYIANLRPMPYWTSFIIMVAASRVLGALLMAKFIVGFTLLLLPLSTMRLMVALKRDPRLGLWAFLLCWDYNIAWGWLTHCLGISLALFTLANTLEASDVKGALRVWPFSIVLALTHVLPSGVMMLSAGLAALVSSNPWRRIWIHALALSGSIIGLAPWLLAQLGGKAGEVDAPAVWQFNWHSPAYKLGQLLNHTLGLIPGETAALYATLGVLVLMFGPLLLAGLRQRPSSESGRQATLMAIGIFAIYFAAPLNVFGPIWHTYTYPRFASCALLFLLFVPAPVLRGVATWALAPGLLAVVLYDHSVYNQFKEFGAESRPFLKIIDAVEPNRSVFPLTFDDSSRATALASYNQFHAYIVANKKGYDPFLFDYPSSPLIYRASTRPPQTSWDRPFDFRMETVGKFYDYILVQGLQSDPLVARPDVSLVVESGRWRLYAVKEGPTNRG